MSNDLSVSFRSLVLISPDNTISETIEHNVMYNIFEIIGYLGGHAHIWLGLSAIQFYNVVSMLYAKLTFCYDKIKQQHHNHQ